jgi:hypothetical protein
MPTYVQNTMNELNCIYEMYSKFIIESKNDVIYELPLNISKMLLSDWIDVTDICRIDEAYCNETKRKKINKLQNDSMVYGLQNTADEVDDLLYLEQKHKIYLNWLINHKNIQIKYFTNICNTIAYTKYNKIQTVGNGFSKSSCKFY